MVKPVLQEAIVKGLREVGPMRIAELMKYTGRTESVVYQALIRLKLKHIVYVSNWGRAAGNKGGVYAAIYDLGAGPDVPKPKAEDPRSRNVRYRQRNRAVIRVRDILRRKKNGAAAGIGNPWRGLLK